MSAAPVIAAAMAARYEPSWLVDQAVSSLSWCDEVVVYRDPSTEPWTEARARNAAVLDAARATGAEWVFFTAPDERLESGAAALVRAHLATAAEGTRYALRLRELWTPDAYRVDGVWGAKTRVRIYRLDEPKARTILLPLNLYHLKMIDPANRTERVRVFERYNTWDNATQGFSYLTDERGLELETIPEGHGYHPPYRPYTFRVPDEG